MTPPRHNKLPVSTLNNSKIYFVLFEYDITVNWCFISITALMSAKAMCCTGMIMMLMLWRNRYQEIMAANRCKHWHHLKILVAKSLKFETFSRIWDIKFVIETFTRIQDIMSFIAQHSWCTNMQKTAIASSHHWIMEAVILSITDATTLTLHMTGPEGQVSHMSAFRRLRFHMLPMENINSCFMAVSQFKVTESYRELVLCGLIHV